MILVLVALLAGAFAGQGECGPVPRCWDYDGPPDYECCVRDDGDLCLCGASIEPSWRRFPIDYSNWWPYMALYRVRNFPHLIEYGLSGPGQLADCRHQSIYDVSDHDGDVDLRDVADLFNEWSTGVMP